MTIPPTFLPLDSAIDNYGSRIHKLCQKLCGRSDWADDACQETWIAYQKLLKIGERPYNIEAWLVTTATRRCASLIRSEASRRKRERRVARETQLTTAHDSSSDNLQEDLVALRTAIAKLPDRHRLPLIMRYIDDMSIDQIASHLGTTAGNARVRVHRSVEKLKRLIPRAATAGLLMGLQSLATGNENDRRETLSATNTPNTSPSVPKPSSSAPIEIGQSSSAQGKTFMTTSIISVIAVCIISLGFFGSAWITNNPAADQHSPVIKDDVTFDFDQRLDVSYSHFSLQEVIQYYNAKDLGIDFSVDPSVNQFWLHRSSLEMSWPKPTLREALRFSFMHGFNLSYIATGNSITITYDQTRSALKPYMISMDMAFAEARMPDTELTNVDIGTVIEAIDQQAVSAMLGLKDDQTVAITESPHGPEVIPDEPYLKGLFFHIDPDINVNTLPRVTITKQNQSARDILHQALTQTGLTYEHFPNGMVYIRQWEQ